MSDELKKLAPMSAPAFTGEMTFPLIGKRVDLGVVRDRVTALVIAIRLMEMHLEMATPDGVGRDSLAWEVAQGRLTVLRDLLDELKALQPKEDEREQ